jgi:hypothetical protein
MQWWRTRHAGVPREEVTYISFRDDGAPFVQLLDVYLTFCVGYKSFYRRPLKGCAMCQSWPARRNLLAPCESDDGHVVQILKPYLYCVSVDRGGVDLEVWCHAWSDVVGV